MTEADARPPAVSQPRRPIVSIVIIGICVGILLLQQVSQEFTIASYSWAAQQHDFVAFGEGYRLLTAAFLHAGLTHLLFNMWALYALGMELERRVGSLPFLALYGASAVGGGAAFQLFGGQSVVVGASGAIFGLFGAWLTAAWKARGSVAGRAGLRQMMTLLGINLALPLFIPGIAWQAHLGGFAIGIAVTAVWMNGGARTAVARTAVAVLGMIISYFIAVM